MPSEIGITCGALAFEQINPDVFFTYQPQLEAVEKATKSGSPERLKLAKLIELLKIHYVLTGDKLSALAQHKDIELDLLSVISVKIPLFEKARCLRFDFGKVHLKNGDMSCRYLTRDGKCFG